MQRSHAFHDLTDLTDILNQMIKTKCSTSTSLTWNDRNVLEITVELTRTIEKFDHQSLNFLKYIKMIYPLFKFNRDFHSLKIFQFTRHVTPALQLHFVFCFLLCLFCLHHQNWDSVRKLEPDFWGGFFSQLSI